MRPQQVPAILLVGRYVHVQRILNIACRMTCRGVERVETMPFILYLRAVGHYKPDLSKSADDVLGHLRQWMESAQQAPPAGKREIGWFLRQRGFEFELCAARHERVLEF